MVVVPPSEMVMVVLAVKVEKVTLMVVVVSMMVVGKTAVTVDVARVVCVLVGMRLVAVEISDTRMVVKRVTVVIPVKGLKVVLTWVIVRVVCVVRVVRIVGLLT